MQKTSLLKPYHPIIQTYFYHQKPPCLNQGIRYALAQGPSQVATITSVKSAIEFNFKTMETACELAASYQVQLISFPELFLSGYALKDPQTADAAAQYLLDEGYINLNGKISKLAAKYHLAIICPLPYKGADPEGNKGVYDASLFINNEGILLGIQLKTHLWGEKEYSCFRSPIYDMSSQDPAQNPYRTFVINGYPVGVAICYDAEFPEVARCLALNGALLMVMPTAAPLSMIPGQLLAYPDISLHYIPANSLQNQNFCSYGNRCGWEYSVDNGIETKIMQYSGNSIICDPYGSALVRAVRNEDTLLMADCVMSNFPAMQPTECNYIINRRPDLYKILTQKVGLY